MLEQISSEVGRGSSKTGVATQTNDFHQDAIIGKSACSERQDVKVGSGQAAWEFAADYIDRMELPNWKNVDIQTLEKNPTDRISREMGNMLMRLRIESRRAFWPL